MNACWSERVTEPKIASIISGSATLSNDRAGREEASEKASARLSHGLGLWCHLRASAQRALSIWSGAVPGSSDEDQRAEEQ